MFGSSYRRSRQRQRAVRYGVYAFLFFVGLDIFRLLGSYRTFSNNLLLQKVTHTADLPREVHNQKIFITAQFWTSEDVLATFWLTQFLKLVEVLGRDNIYVSILSSGSFDNTPDAVRWLDVQLGKLGVERTIDIDPTTHAEAVNASWVDEYGHHKSGWIETNDPNVKPGTKELRRIPYLSDLRNRGLEPLINMHMKHGRMFDKILYLNDVYFEPSDILTLIATNQGHYDVACGIDFHYPPAFYDTFALRDIEKRGPVMATFPYFRAKGTREDIMAGVPARVASCWNGVLIADAAPYYDKIRGDGHSQRMYAGLRFRGVPDSLALYHLEASECCLIHADLVANGYGTRGIYLNPAVRVGYNPRAYALTHTGPEKGFVSRWGYVTGTWRNRIARWKTDAISSSAGQNMKEIYRKISKWEAEGAKYGEHRKEVGGFCTIDEMHILIWNGWKHV